MKKLVIIPAFNESENLLRVVEDLKEHTDGYDYVIINDASTDDTKEVCEKNGLHFLDLATNLGIGGAVQTGYLYAKREDYDIAVQIDGDGQHDASALTNMEEFLLNSEEKPDMVIGSRYIEHDGFQSTGLRRAGIRWFSFLIRLMTRTKITDPTSGLRMCRKEVISMFAEKYPWDYPEPETTASLLAKGYKVAEVPVTMRKRQGGKSSISNPFKALYYMLKVSLGIMIEVIGGSR